MVSTCDDICLDEDISTLFILLETNEKSRQEINTFMTCNDLLYILKHSVSHSLNKL